MLSPKIVIPTSNNFEMEIEIPDEWVGKKIEVVIDEVKATIVLRKYRDTSLNDNLTAINTNEK
jgi:hypothetical protein